MDLPALGRAYRDLRPQLDEIASELKFHLVEHVRSCGVKGANVSSRVKETDSFVKKAWERSLRGEPWDDAIQQCSDKVGGRVDVVYLADVMSLRAAIEADDSFQVVKVDDKAVSLGPNQLGYGGLHIDVYPPGRREEHFLCEIQLRTHAQAAWAMASHELDHKGPAEPTSEQLRRLNRLTALVELFDEVVDQVKDEIMESPGYPLAVLLNRLDSLWRALVGQPYNAGLTERILQTLLDDMDRTEAARLSEDLSAFVEARNEDILAALAGSGDDPLLTQPESLLVFFFLDRDKWNFEERWTQGGLDWQLLESAALGFGVRLGQPS